jgi:hypothetical protein
MFRETRFGSQADGKQNPDALVAITHDNDYHSAIQMVRFAFVFHDFQRSESFHP